MPALASAWTAPGTCACGRRFGRAERYLVASWKQGRARDRLCQLYERQGRIGLVTCSKARCRVIFADTAGPEKIVRRGILSCSVYDPHCMFLMMLLEESGAEKRYPVPWGRTIQISVQ